MDEMPGMIRPDLQALFPACAGVNPWRRSPLRSVPPFPRLCGGDPIFFESTDYGKVFSPPTRGVIPISARTSARSASFPRLCGGDPTDGTLYHEDTTFSPPVRG